MLLVRQWIFLVVLMPATLSFGQIPRHLFNEVSGESYPAKDFSSRVGPLKERAGAYHFGDSEGEWDLVVLQNGDSLIIQIWNGIWAKDHFTKATTWLRQCRTFNRIKVEGNKFFFGKFSGCFVDYKANGKSSKKGVLLFCDPFNDRIYGRDSAEVGHYTTTAADFFSEWDYYQLSVKIQPEKYFSGKSKRELKIMRNSILAKYGLIFQAGGEMEKYFRKKEWYKPYLKDVSGCLTEIERKNIGTMLGLEKEAR